MNIKFKFLAALVCLLGNIITVTLANPTENKKNLPPCNEPAPSNYHISEIFTNEIRVVWDAPAINPFEYNIKVFETSSGNLVHNFNIPGTATFARAVFLQGGTEYEIRAAPVCSDGTISHYFSSGVGTTLIVDLIVSGFSLPNSNTTCGMVDKDEYCEADPDEDKIVIFRVRSISNPNVGRYFGLFNADDECTSSKIKVYPGSSPFQFYCDVSTSPTCFAQKVIIKFNGSKIAEFSVSEESNGNPKHLFCSADNAADYEIVRYGNYSGVTDPIGGNCGSGGGNGLSSDPKNWSEAAWASIHANPYLTASPNPFNNQLDIQIPFTIINENIELNLYDLQGRRVMTLHSPGDQQTITLNTEKCLPGMYFLRVESGGVVQTIKVVKTE